MSGYIDLNRTGFAAFDDVLTAIEEAGHAFHNTSQWQDEGWEGTPSQIELINAKIDDAQATLKDTIQVSRAEYEALRRDAERWQQVKEFVEVAPSMLNYFSWTYRMKPMSKLNANDKDQLAGQDQEFTLWLNKLSDAGEGGG